jgi:DNA (cytosine-5)-methyltransferase 1
MRVVSLFSGAGGLDYGLVRTGMTIVWANDIFENAVETYRENVGRHIDTRDICSVESDDIPDCDVVVGGFPCQGFSIANWGRNIEDPRNQLYKQLVRVVAAKRPRYFVGENVRGLASFAKGAVLRQIISEFEDLGYRVHHQIVNAADYGVPQNRMRMLIVGERIDVPPTLIFPPKRTHADPDVAKIKRLKPWLSVGKALAHYPEPETPNAFHNHECSKYKLRFNGHLGHRRIEADRPSPTVTARGDEKGGVVVLHHPNNHRRMTVREMAAVQSFPDDFVFVGTKTSAYRQIANAVPPLLGEAIGRMLLEAAASGAYLDKREAVAA